MSDSATRVGSPVARATATASSAHARTWSVASTSAPPTIVRRPSSVARRCSSSGGSASSASSRRRTRGRSGTNAVTHRLAPASALARVDGVRAPAGQLRGLLVEVQRRVEVAEPAQRPRPGRGPRSRGARGAPRIPAPTSRASHRRRAARGCWPATTSSLATSRATSTASADRRRARGGAQPVPGGGRASVERADGGPTRSRAGRAASRASPSRWRPRRATRGGSARHSAPPRRGRPRALAGRGRSRLLAVVHELARASTASGVPEPAIAAVGQQRSSVIVEPIE